jgi:hypothetical protein
VRNHREESLRIRVVPGLALCLALFIGVPVAAESSQSDTELWSYLQRQSALWWQNDVARSGQVDPGAWQEPIENAFLRLEANSGQPVFAVSYAVLADEDFNAASYPGGEFVIHQGTLRLLDSIIAAQVGKLEQVDPAKLRLYRETLLAPVIAHELGHFYNRHLFASMKVQFSMSQLGQPDVDLQLIRFSQENELEADRTGYLLLVRAGYDPASMLAILQLLNGLQQQELGEDPEASTNLYLSSHPSPHARLAAFPGEDQALHSWAAGLEQAFADVQLGTNLPAAIAVLDKGLTLVPRNLYLEKERAIALHKRWLLTVSLQEQKLKGILDSPAFRDDMVFPSREGRGVRVLPGDRALWIAARQAYMDTYQRAMDQSFTLDFSLLLAYSTDASEMRAAVTLASGAAEDLGTLSAASNLAVVLYVTDHAAAAVEILTQVAAWFDSSSPLLAASSPDDPDTVAGIASLREQMRLTGKLDPRYVYGDFTPMLNLSLLSAYQGQAATAAARATRYLKAYESGSAWAAYLSRTTGVSLPSPPKRVPLPVNGVSVGNPLTVAVAAWGKADGVRSYADGIEEWSYSAIASVLGISNGFVASIGLGSGRSPKVNNRFGVGSPRGEVEKELGAPTRTSDAYVIYDGTQRAAIRYVKEIAQEIILFQ